MHSTREVIRLLILANPTAAITEERIRRALRRGSVSIPSMFAGRLAWTDSEVNELAASLGLRSPLGDATACTNLKPNT